MSGPVTVASASKKRERSKWRDLGPTRQAGMRCKEPLFWAFLAEELGLPVTDEEIAAVTVRFLCGVKSRRDLDRLNGIEARMRWRQLDKVFQAWRAAENA